MTTEAEEHVTKAIEWLRKIDAGGGPGTQQAAALLDEMERLQKAPSSVKSEDDKRDAERYRWIRAHSYVERLDMADGIGIIHCGLGYQQTRPEFLDADVDAAMAYPVPK
jgi:hypothetical protein